MTYNDLSCVPWSLHWYKEHVLRGARENGLPDHYVRKIELTHSIDDYDVEHQNLRARNIFLEASF